jgi:hypothetical protein
LFFKRAGAEIASTIGVCANVMEEILQEAILFKR